MVPLTFIVTDLTLVSIMFTGIVFFVCFLSPLVGPRFRLNNTMSELVHIDMPQTGFMHRLSDRTKGQLS